MLKSRPHFRLSVIVLKTSNKPQKIIFPIFVLCRFFFRKVEEPQQQKIFFPADDEEERKDLQLFTFSLKFRNFVATVSSCSTDNIFVAMFSFNVFNLFVAAPV